MTNTSIDDENDDLEDEDFDFGEGITFEDLLPSSSSGRLPLLMEVIAAVVSLAISSTILSIIGTFTEHWSWSRWVSNMASPVPHSPLLKDSPTWLLILFAWAFLAVVVALALLGVLSKDQNPIVAAFIGAAVYPILIAYGAVFYLPVAAGLGWEPFGS